MKIRKQSIIGKVEGSTPWLSPLFAIPKMGRYVQLGLDMCVPNQALTWCRVQIPTVDEILPKDTTIFSEEDLSQGYLQVMLAEESRYITAFQTPNDKPHPFTHLIMGACPLKEYFTKSKTKLSEMFRTVRIHQKTYGYSSSSCKCLQSLKNSDKRVQSHLNLSSLCSKRSYMAKQNCFFLLHLGCMTNVVKAKRLKEKVRKRRSLLFPPHFFDLFALTSLFTWPALICLAKCFVQAEYKRALSHGPISLYGNICYAG